MTKTLIQQNDPILKMYAPNNMPILHKEELKESERERQVQTHHCEIVTNLTQ